ncbi:hypothetical protein QQX98_001368 [Neonectria punicea]|uniref:Uncharacterized protein n=1 Tax=Neonectria punicea TaxID=979145 RepID=A0ABR1HPR0_9HYPO
MSACESIPSGLPAPLDLVAATDRHWRKRLQEAAISMEPLLATAFDSLDQFWEKAVSTYTRCDLTYPSDRLKAFWGIAKLVRDALGEEYGEGLWANGLHEQLAWRSANDDPPPRPEEKENETEQALEKSPSWSWASLKGPLFQLKKHLFHHRDVRVFNSWKEDLEDMGEKLKRKSLVGARQQQAKGLSEPTRPTAIASTSTEPSKLADFSPELSAHSIAIQGHVGHGTLEQPKDGNRWVLVAGPDQHSNASSRAFPDYKPHGASCKFLLLAASHVSDSFEDRYSGLGILVESVGEAIENRFRRVGAFTFLDVEQDDWDVLRRACGQTPEQITAKVKVEDGIKIWLE